MNDNTAMTIPLTALILTMGSCATVETYVNAKAKTSPDASTNTATVLALSYSVKSLEAANKNTETLGKLVDLHGTTIEKIVQLNRRVHEIEMRLQQPPKTVVEGWTNILIESTTNMWYNRR